MGELRLFAMDKDKKKEGGKNVIESQSKILDYDDSGVNDQSRVSFPEALERKKAFLLGEKVSLEEEEINDDGDEGEEDAIISTAKSKKNKSQALGSSCTIDTSPNLAAVGNATTVQ